MVCGYAVLQNIWAYLQITWLKIEMWGVYEGLLMAVVHSITDDNVGSSMVRSIL
jgi:exopolyphosphatase/pppGpp-phosphohydrolase